MPPRNKIRAAKKKTTTTRQPSSQIGFSLFRTWSILPRLGKLFWILGSLIIAVSLVEIGEWIVREHPEFKAAMEVCRMMAAGVIAHVVVLPFAFRDIRSQLETQHKPLLEKVDKVSSEVLSIRHLEECGVTAIHLDRPDVIHRIKSEISRENEKVWLLGATLGKDIKLDSYIKLLADKKEKNDSLDLRILLSDPLRSPTLFRMLLEEQPELARGYLASYYERRNASTSPSFLSEFANVFHAIQSNPLLHESIKFYAHLCSAWIVRAGPVIYYEPCFIPRLMEDGKNIGFGPIFRVEQGPDARFFAALETHFTKLWNTSTATPLSMSLRWNRKDENLTKIFDARKNWFATVADYHPTHPNTPRIAYRERCETAGSMYEIGFTINQEKVSFKATLQDYTECSLGLRTQNKNELHTQLMQLLADTEGKKKGSNTRPRVEIAPVEDGAHEVGKAVIPKNGSLQLIRVQADDGSLSIALINQAKWKRMQEVSLRRSQ